MAEMKIANRLRVLRRSGIYLLVIAGMALLFFLQRAPWKIPDDLIETLRNPNAGRLLQERATKDKRLIPSLIGLLKDEGRAILERSLATAILAKIGALSVPLLIECLESENPAVRLKAVMVLQQMGPEARGATAALCRALQDDSLPVQQEAFEALTVIHPDGEALLPALAELLESPRKDVRLDTVAKLSQMGEKATQSLLQGLNDEEPDVREQIVSVVPACSAN